MLAIIVTDVPQNWDFLNKHTPIVSATEYLSDEHYFNSNSLRIINLCKSYNHQTIGYYVSLLAHARGHKVIPSVHCIQDVLDTSISKLISQEIDEEIDQSLHEIKGNEFILSIYFGQNLAKRYNNLCKKLHGLFPMPLLRFILEKKKQQWRIKNVFPLAFADIPINHIEFMKQAAECYLNKKRFHQFRKKTRYHDLAILIDPNETTAPSNKKAIEHFVDAGECLGLNVDIIEKYDNKSLAEYDALFIRTTTAVNHYTYKMARRAYQENMVVIDDPESIIKCCNKVYLAELMRSHQILTPETTYISKYDLIPKLIFPCVLKKPDSAFSQGVIKIEDEKHLVKFLHQFFKTSDLVLAQRFIPTEFDWRVGVLDNKPIFACQYYMAQNHWQIYNWRASKDKKAGKHETVALNQVPEAIIKLALKCTKLIGDGLYGVDIKSSKGKLYVIEVNDNPNIDAGIEDQLTGDSLYDQIMNVFLHRIRRKHGYV